MTRTKRLAVLTTGRQDWGLLRPLCEALRDDDRFDLVLLVGGMALRPEFGNTIAEIRRLGFSMDAELDFHVAGNNAASQAGAAVDLVGAALRKHRPDALVLLGDRFETAGAALAATIETIPVVHLFGGEETEGAFDNSLRHAITKLSHLHLVAHDEYARRVIQMGEDPGTVHVIPNLATCHLEGLTLPPQDELEGFLGIGLEPPVVLVTLHPTTLAVKGEDELAAVLEAINAIEATFIITLPNADPGNGRIRDAFLELAKSRPRVVTVEALGELRYLGVMAIADAVLGNSSSGLTEAPAFGVPTVNVGDRQKGRARGESIIDVPSRSELVVSGVCRAIEMSLRDGKGRRNGIPFERGAVHKLVEILANFTPDDPPRKKFYRASRFGVLRED